MEMFLLNVLSQLQAAPLTTPSLMITSSMLRIMPERTGFSIMRLPKESCQKMVSSKNCLMLSSKSKSSWLPANPASQLWRLQVVRSTSKKSSFLLDIKEHSSSKCNQRLQPKTNQLKPPRPRKRVRRSQRSPLPNSLRKKLLSKSEK